MAPALCQRQLTRDSPGDRSLFRERIDRALPRSAVALTLGLLILPITFGLLGTLLPAFGYLPALGGDHLSLQPFRDLAATPGLATAAVLSVATGLAATFISLGITLIFVASYAGTPTLSRLQHLLSPLLAVPHAAAAFGFAFLIAPSGFSSSASSRHFSASTGRRIFSSRMIRWADDDRGPGDQGNALPLLVTLAALPQVELAAARRLAASFAMADRGLCLPALAGALPADPFRRLCRHCLLVLGGGRGPYPRTQPARHAGNPARPVDE